MESAIATILSLIAIGGAADSKSLARADFGGHWSLVIALNVANTLVVLFYVWRIWREKLPPIHRTTT